MKGVVLAGGSCTRLHRGLCLSVAKVSKSLASRKSAIAKALSRATNWRSLANGLRKAPIGNICRRTCWPEMLAAMSARPKSRHAISTALGSAVPASRSTPEERVEAPSVGRTKVAKLRMFWPAITRGLVSAAAGDAPPKGDHPLGRPRWPMCRLGFARPGTGASLPQMATYRLGFFFGAGNKPSRCICFRTFLR